MFFRVKYLIAGMAPASELYSNLKSKLENDLLLGDIAELEVLGPYPEPDGRTYPVVPVTLKFETHGYDSEASILFDLFITVGELREKLAEENFRLGVEEISVDGWNAELPEVFMLGALPVVEL